MSVKSRVRKRLKASFLGPVVNPLLRPYEEYRKRRRHREEFLRELRPTDVFQVGHPKSGNTWLAYMLAILYWKDYEQRINLGNVRERIPHIHHREYIIAKYQDLADPRIFRQEEPQFPEFYNRVVFLLRDPRAALLSYYHMYLVHFGISPEEVPLGDFVREYLKNDCIEELEPYLIRWDRHARYWMERARQGSGIILVKYEEMIADRGAVLGRVADFIGIPYSAEDLALAVGRGSFEAMQRNEYSHGVEGLRRAANKEERFIRKGKVDSWREEMPLEVAEAIVGEFRPVMEQVGYLP